MNKSLDTSDEKTTDREKRIDSFEKAGRSIISKLKESSHDFETFYSLLSAIVWQSPTELAEAWVQKVAKEEYAELLKTDGDKEMGQIKAQIRHGLLGFISNVIYQFSQNRSLVQRMKSQLLVQNILAHELPANDQDRILSKEMGIPYGTWQMMLGLFSHNPDFMKLLELPSTNIGEGMNASGETIYIFNAPEGSQEQISSISSIPGISVENHLTIAMVIDKNKELIPIAIESPLLFISNDVLKRYEGIIGKEKERADVRTAIYKNSFDVEIPVWKKRFDIGGHDKPEPKHEHKLMPEGMF